MSDSQLYQDFTGRDYTARFEALLTRLKAEVPELTDFNHSDAGISLLRLLAREVDQLQFYLDEAFAESFVPTARFMQSLIDLATLTDYPPKLASGAITTLRVSRVAGNTALVDIPQYTAFSNSAGLSFVTLAPAVLQPTADYVDVQAMQGEVKVETLEPSDFEIIDLSNRYKYNLGQGVVASTVELYNTSLGLSWSKVDSFWRSLSTDRHFLLQLYADEWEGETSTVFLVLGDGVKGRGQPEQEVTVRWVATSGASGNLGAGVITTAPQSLFGLVTVTNTTTATGGSDAEPIEEYRERIPEITRTQRRMIAGEDYEAAIEAIAGVEHCQLVDRNNDDEWPHLYVVLYVVPEGGGAMSDTLKNTIWAECAAWGHLGSWKGRYILKDVTQVSVDVTCRIKVESGYIESTVTSAVYSAIDALFDTDKMEIGENLSFTSLQNATQAVEGVSWVEFDKPKASVAAGDGEQLVAGTISVTAV